MRKKNLLFGMVIALSLYLSVFAFSGASVRAEGKDMIPVAPVSVQDEYLLDTYFDMPVCSFSSEGETETASALLYSPSGKVYDAKKVKLNETGIWQTEFTAFTDCTYRKNFTVYKSTYEVTSPDGSVEVKSEPKYFPLSGNGLCVNLPNGVGFRYNETIDLSKLTRNDNIAEVGIWPNSAGNSDIEYLSVYLTDIYDKDNYTEYCIHNPNNKDAGAYGGMGTLSVSYAGANATMGATSIYPDSSNRDRISTFCDSLFYGSYTPFSFNGSRDKLGGKDPVTAICFDYNENECHSSSIVWHGEPVNPKYKTYIADLDKTDFSDCDLYGDGKTFEKPFRGFTTGEVYLSVKAHGYSSPNCNIFIKSIIGADFSRTKSYDGKAPYISVAADKDNLPIAVAGREYRIFEAKAVDNELKDLTVYTQVYSIYQGNRISRYSVIDGAFIPDAAGTYEIYYSVRDGFGNESHESLFVQAADSLSPPEITVSGEYEDGYYVTDRINILPCEAKSFSGTPEITIKVLLGNEEVNVTDGSFVAEKEGTYTIEYAASDYIGQKSVSLKTIEVSYSDNPIVTGNIVLPNGFIHGSVYDLSAPVAVYFEEGARKECAPDIFVTDGNGEHKLTDGLYQANLSDNVKTVHVKYVYSFAKEHTDLEYDVPVIAPVNLPGDLEQYFLLDGDVICRRNPAGDMEFDFSGEGKVSYIKSVPVKEFNIELAVASTGEEVFGNGDAVNIYLSDTKEKDDTVKITIHKIDEVTAKISVNDGRMYDYAAAFSGKTAFNVVYNNTMRYVLAGNQKIMIDKTLSGKSFDGFTHNAANLTLSVDNAADFRLVLKSMDLQGFDSLVDGDYLGPQLYINGDMKHEYGLNEKFGTFTAYAIDVLSENAVVSLSVMSPDDEYMVRDADAAASHEIVLDKYGIYKLIYRATDINGMETIYNMSLNVPDKEVPSLKLSMYDFSCKADVLIDLPVATFSDNVSGVENMRCYLSYLSPEGKEFLIDGKTDGNTFKAQFAFGIPGTWKLKYLVYDESRNIATEEIYVVVKGENAGDTKKSEEAKEIILIGNNASSYVIAVPAAGESGERSGAKLIQEYLYKATGYNMAITDDESLPDDKKFISLGETSLYTALENNADRASFNGDGFAIKEKDGNFYIIGGENLKAYVFASYRFLHEAINLENYYYDEIAYDETDKIMMGHLDIKEVPTFKYRMLYNGTLNESKAPGQYSTLLQLDDVVWSGASGHSIFILLPPDIYYDEHTEWYTGRTLHDQLCWSQEDMLEEMSVQVVKAAANNPNATHIMIGQNDGRNWCGCAKCKAEKEKYGTDSAVLIKGINHIARRVKEQLPDRNIQITTFAYTTTAKPPVKKDAEGNYIPINDSVICEDNVSVRYAPIDTDYSRSFYDNANSVHAENAKGWGAVCKNIVIWNYNTNFSYYMIPFCNWNVIKDDYVFYAENGVNAMFDQGGSQQPGFQECKNYVTAKLMWNCNLNEKDLIESFFLNYYKDAAGSMYKFFDEYRQWYNVIEKENSVINGGIYARYGSVPNVFPLPVADRWQGYIDEAKASIEYIKEISSELYQKLYDRIEKESVFIDYVKLFFFENNYSAGELYDMRSDFVYKCKYFGINNLSELASMEGIYQDWRL